MKEEMKSLNELDLKQMAESIAAILHVQLGGSFSVVISKMELQKNRTVVDAYSGIQLTATATDETFSERLRGGSSFTPTEVAEIFRKGQRDKSLKDDSAVPS
jgi:hypothetical protein